jgi:predicted  nucleic acid-binding Zn-ribbon protein
MNQIVKNMETGKLELHFDKSDYQALTDDEKAELKSAYLWSNRGKCWVSRAKEPNTWRAEQVAKKLGFSGIEEQGERISYAEQLERKAARAEARAERYEEYAANAQARGKTLQKPIESMRGDIAFFTQPIIAGHSGSQAFARRRDKMFEQYGRGFDEYRKSEYFQERAATARATADNAKLQNRVYLDNRIKECNKALRDLQKSIVAVENNIYAIQQGGELKAWDGTPLTIAGQEQRLEDILDRYEVWQDKLNFFEDAMSALGGVKFSKENIKSGYIVEIARWGKCEVISAGPENITYKLLEGGAAGGVLTDAYAAIERIVKATEQKEALSNPFSVGNIVCKERSGDGSIYKAYQVIKVTEKSVRIQEIHVEKGVPQPDSFVLGSKPMLRKITASKYSDFVGIYEDGWQLHKWTPKEATALPTRAGRRKT